MKRLHRSGRMLIAAAFAFLMASAWAGSATSLAEDLHVGSTLSSDERFGLRDHAQMRFLKVDSHPSDNASLASDAAAAPSRTFVLSADERAYLRSLPPLTVALDSSSDSSSTAYPPSYSNSVVSDDVAYLSRALGINLVHRRYPDWAEASAAFARGDVDILAGAARDASNARVTFEFNAEFNPLSELVDRAMKSLPETLPVAAP